MDPGVPYFAASGWRRYELPLRSSLRGLSTMFRWLAGPDLVLTAVTRPVRAPAPALTPVPVPS
ncbi:hypothetical protein ACFTWH_17840 [Streptomyces sp. NPDC057011]|uniref:hypothetical protein n=1 Tax=unclassified Streptomyces TaxID=2593676 RepID=UPI0036417D13